jgi:hypothetical protein
MRSRETGRTILWAVGGVLSASLMLPNVAHAATAQAVGAGPSSAVAAETPGRSPCIDGGSPFDPPQWHTPPKEWLRVFFGF